MQGAFERAFVLCVIKRTGQCLEYLQNNTWLGIVVIFSVPSQNNRKGEKISFVLSVAIIFFLFKSIIFSFYFPFTQNVNVKNEARLKLIKKFCVEVEDLKTPVIT